MTVTFLLLSPASAVAEKDARTGAVYAMTNELPGNAIAVFHRAADGTLTNQGTFSTGGRGSGGFDQSQNALVLSGHAGAETAPQPDRLLFAVNAGSNEISVLAVQNNGSLTLVSKAPSGGVRPNSVTVHKNLVYVLNAGALPLRQGVVPNISGFTLSPSGQITPLPGSNAFLTGGALAGAAQIQFTPDGDALLVSERNSNLIDAFQIGEDGRPSGPIPNSANSVAPFGFAFASVHGRVELITADGFQAGPLLGRASTYGVSNNGALTPLGFPVGCSGAPMTSY